MKQTELIEKKGLRETLVGRTEVLDKVGDLLLLPNTDYGTTGQVADYYKVDTDVIRQTFVRNADELTSDGAKTIKGNELRDTKSLCGLKTRANSMTIFPKRAILRIGMLLRNSEVAKEIRTRLLNIIDDIEKDNPEIIQNVVTEISEERQLIMERVEAELNGDIDQICVINGKLFKLKNKRIMELEKQNKEITSHALTITESRAVINRITRSIAVIKFNGMFGKAYKELYTQVNYKLGININSRAKKQNASCLSTLTERETFEVEQIARNWATKLDIDLDELLSLK